MTDASLTIEEFQLLVRSLLGLTVSLPWKGYGSTIFLEIGDLSPLDSTRHHHNKGAACISVEWDWRVEKGSAVLFGSSSRRPVIEAGIKKLSGAAIKSVSVAGPVPELVVHFSNDFYLRSMLMTTGDSVWSVKLLDLRWVYVRDGLLHIGRGEASFSEQEKEAFAIAEQTAARWGVPNVPTQRGFCEQCKYFVPLDGEGSLLDYGCCIEKDSPFDGRAVSRRSSCRVYSNVDLISDDVQQAHVVRLGGYRLGSPTQEVSHGNESGAAPTRTLDG